MDEMYNDKVCALLYGCESMELWPSSPRQVIKSELQVPENQSSIFLSYSRPLVVSTPRMR